MCYIQYLSPGVTPALEQLQNAAKLNPDGYGWVIPVAPLRGGLLFMRTLDAQEAVDTFMAARIRCPDGPAAFHCRYSTGGELSSANCQPVSAGGSTLIMHNGYMFDTADGRSDTRVFATEILPRWELDDLGRRALLESTLGKGNKVLILTSEPRYNQQVYLLNGDSSTCTWEGSRRWHSNDDYTGAGHRHPGICGVCNQQPTTELICRSCHLTGTLREQALRER